MGCFIVLRCKKKIYEHFVGRKPVNVKEKKDTTVPDSRLREPSLQSAPPSFKSRAKPIQSVNNSRARALSAPSSLHLAEQEAFAVVESLEQDDLKNRGVIANPLPLPLPYPHGSSNFKNAGSFNGRGPVDTSGPLPLPPLGSGGLRNFSFDEISAACQHFSVDRCVSEGISSAVYKASFGDDSRKLEATVTRLLPSSQGLKEFVNEVNTIASLQHPQLCKLLGFHAREGSEHRMLVYERLYHGSLDRLLYGRSEGPSIDWSTRMKVALCAAKGLAYLHEEGPFQAMYNEFSTANIQVDKDFSAKLSGYGCVSYIPDVEISNSSVATGNLFVETLERRLLTPKSNVWSFGIVLLELLTGRKNYDSRHPKEERNIVKWSRPFLADDCRLALIIDPRIKARVPPKAARIVTDIVLKCLQKDPSERPTMRAIVESLNSVQDMKYPCRFPLQEPSAVAGKPMVKSPSFNNIIPPAPPLNFSSSPPLKIPPSVSSPRSSLSILQPLQPCSSSKKLSPTPPAQRWPGVEGF